MIKKILILAFLTLTFNSCSLDSDTPNFGYETLPIKEAIVPDEFQFGSTYTITVKYGLPSTCYSFHELYYQYDGTSRIVAINAMIYYDEACRDVATEKEYDFPVSVTQSEDYVFKFWKGKDSNGQDIFDEVVVPVVQ